MRIVVYLSHIPSGWIARAFEDTNAARYVASSERAPSASFALRELGEAIDNDASLTTQPQEDDA